VIQPALDLRPRVIGAVSAGAAIACAASLGRIDAVLASMKRRTAANPRNLHPGNWLRGEPVFPHERIYRETILEHLGGSAIERIHAGPDIRVLLSHPPAWLGARSSLPLALVAHGLERLTRRRRLHAIWGRRLGFRGEAISVRRFRNAEELCALILQSSCTPPLTPHYRRGGRAILDGGLVDGAPTALVRESRSSLVLVPRHLPPSHLPRRPGCTYVVPSRPVPIDVWDYTSPDRLQQTFDLGRRDGEAFVAAGLREIGRDDVSRVARPAPLSELAAAR
jgi:predicted acylesterase/phospholipase RssA